MRLRRLVAALVFTALALASALSVAPQVHTWLHKAGDGTNHECAATLLSSGSVDHSACEPPPTRHENEPAEHTFRAQPFARVLGFFAFSRLEHAPPARS